MNKELPERARPSDDEAASDCPKARAVIAAARAVVEVAEVYQNERLPTPLVGALMQLSQRLEEL